MFRIQAVEFLPEVLIHHRALRLRTPAVALPAVNPGGDAVLQVFGVGDDLDFARFGERFEAADGGGQLHAVVGGVRDAARMVRETNCDAVMVGRAASSNPWIFRQIAQYLETGSYETPPEHARYEMMRRYYTMLQEHGAADAVGKMKQFATYFTHGVRNGSKLRADIYHAHQPAEILSMVDAFFEQELAVTP